MSFVIPPAIAKFYKISGGLANARAWKAKVLAANSGEAKIGSWDSVGYILVSMSSDTIIPIARNDEHHTGFDVLFDKLIPLGAPNEKYYPIAPMSKNYVYPEDAKAAMPVFEKWLGMGGADLTVGDSSGKYTGTMSDFIKRKGDVTLRKGELNPIGQAVINNLGTLATQLKAALGNPNLIKGFNKNAANFVEWCEESAFGFLLGDTVKHYADIEIAPDLSLAEQTIFGADGIKNKLHNMIRKTIADPNGGLDARDMAALFGDINVAMAEFNRIGSI